MTENRFDEQIRKALEGYEVEPDAGIWEAIESTLARKARFRVIRRVAGYSAAAAACLVAGLLLFNNGGETSLPAISDNTVAVNVPDPAAPEVPVIEVVKEPVSEPVKAAVRKAPAVVPPIEEQISNFADAYADNTTPVEDEVTVSEPETPATPVKMKPSVKEEKSVTASNIDWNAILAEEEEKSASLFDTPLLAISSNIVSNSSRGGFSPDFGPGRSPSREGSKAAPGLPVPVDEPTYYMPLSFGVQLKLPISRTFSVGIGADYSYIVTRFASLVNGELFNDTYSQLHYVGVPVGVYANLLQNRTTDVYLSFGGAMEKCVGSRYVYGSHVSSGSVPGLQFSAMAGIGVEYWFLPSVGCYLDPSLVYYFANQNNPQPLSIRTAEPLQIRFEAGLRFRLLPQRHHHHPGRRF
ncbi:MAG: hypothetical protein J5699_07345 [Bacteroidales bacterium]|nr:hypothetical protein [Bacteroidales bacterium]